MTNYILIILQVLAEPSNYNMLGAAAIVLFILKEVFSFIRSIVTSSKNGDRTDQDKITDNNVSHIRSDMEWLKEAHDAKNEDGIFRWWFPKSMEQAIHENTAATRENTNILKNIKLK